MMSLSQVGKNFGSLIGFLFGGAVGVGSGMALPRSDDDKVVAGTANKKRYVLGSETVVLAPERTLTPRQSKILEYGLPRTGQFQVKENYVSFVNYARKGPSWVLENLNKDILAAKNADRKNCQFKEDPDVPEFFRAKNSDYLNSGYSRGHMNPAADNKISRTAISETFLLSSNVVPQDFDNNKTYWAMVEEWTRNLVLNQNFDDVFVATGPLYLPQPDASVKIPQIPPPPAIEAGQNSSNSEIAKFGDPEVTPPKINTRTYVEKYIGDNLTVPSHLFKAVVCVLRDPKTSQEYEYYAGFVVPNEPISSKTNLMNYHVDYDDLVRLSGAELFPAAFRREDDSKKPRSLCNDVLMSSKSGEPGKSVCHLRGEIKQMQKYLQADQAASQKTDSKN